MRIITNRSITQCWKKYPDARPSLAIWEERIYCVNCKDHRELKLVFSTVDYIANPNFKHLTVFNIKGNDYRLAVDVFFNTGHVYVKWFGKHGDYDKVDFKKLPNGGFQLC
jgi:mRNA interferase HigB